MLEIWSLMVNRTECKDLGLFTLCQKDNNLSKDIGLNVKQNIIE